MKQRQRQRSGIHSNKSTIRYDLAALKQMELSIHHDQRLQILPFDAVRTIKSLELNVKPKAKRRHKRHGFTQQGVNRANLIMAKKNPTHVPKGIPRP